MIMITGGVIMAFTIKIGSTSDNPLKVSKTVTWTNQQLSISPLSAYDLIAPLFVLDYNSGYLACNYIQDNNTNLYYFIENISVDTAQRMNIKCRIDPLNSYNLSNCNITVTRNGGIGGPTLIPDSKLPVIPNIEETWSAIATSDYFDITDELVPPEDQKTPRYVVITTKAGDIT